MRGEFVFDDLVYIVFNLEIWQGVGRHWTRFFTDHALYSGLAGTVHYRPLVVLSYALNAGSAQDTLPFKLTQVALHVTAVLGLYWSLAVLRRHRPDVPECVPFLAAAWVGVAPFNVEAVHYVTGRSALMCGTFAAWAPGLYLKMRLQRRAGPATLWYLAHLGAVALALSCKETALTLPVAMVALDLLVVRGGAGPSLSGLRLLWPYVPYLAGLAVVGLYMPNVNRATSYLRQVVGTEWRLATAFYCLMENARLMVLPTGLSVAHPIDESAALTDATTLANMAGVAAILAWAWAARRRWPLISFGWVWYLLLIAPSTFVHLNVVLLENRGYPASFGVGIVLAALSGALWRAAARHRRAVALGISAVGVLLVMGTIHREQVWSSGLTLWGDAVKRDPTAPGAYSNLGMRRLNAGDLDGAESALRRALDLAPNFLPAEHLMAQVHVAKGEYAEALALLEPLVAEDPDDPRILLQMAKAQIALARFPEAVVTLHRLAEAERANDRTRKYRYRYRPADTATELVQAALKAGMLEDARWGVRYLREAAPRDPMVDGLTFEVHLAAGEWARAEEVLRRLEARHPGRRQVVAWRQALDAARTDGAPPP